MVTSAANETLTPGLTLKIPNTVSRCAIVNGKMNGAELEPAIELIDRIFPIEEDDSSDVHHSDIPLHRSEWQWGKKQYNITPLDVGSTVIYIAKGGREIRERPETYIADVWLNR